MERSFKEALKHRRSYYQIGNEKKLEADKIKKIVEHAILHVPSAFNSQTTRIVLLLGENHNKLWDITKDALLALIGEERFEATGEKIDTSFLAGYGTILFYEDKSIVRSLEKQFATYADKFDQWSDHTSGMHQLAIWTMLEDAGLGASLQHYNPLIDEAVAKEWDINPDWKLIAQMPFGNVLAEAGEKEFGAVDARFIVHE